MVQLQNFPTYYRNTKPLYHRFFKEIFEAMNFEELKQTVQERSTFDKSSEFDSMYLQEAITFLRLSISYLLAYKYLVCGKHLPVAKVSLYYSYFNAVSSLLRVSGIAVVHIRKRPDSIFDAIPTESLKFQIIQHENHTFSLATVRQNEHQFVWNEFQTRFRDLSSEETGTLITGDRYDWNYGLLYQSQATESAAQREVKERCENNFLDPNFENAEYRHNLMVDYGHEERYAGDLIQECIKILTNVAKESQYKTDYIDSFEKMKNDIDFLKSSESTKDEIKRWLDNAVENITGH